MWIACEGPASGTRIVTIDLGGSTFARVQAGEAVPDGSIVSIGYDGLAYRASLNEERHGHTIGYAVGDSKVLR